MVFSFISSLFGIVDAVRAASHGAHARATTVRCIGWRKHERTDQPIFYVETLFKTGSESIEAILRKRRILIAVFVARTEDMRLLKRVMFRELVRGAVSADGKRKNGWGVSWTTSEISASTPTSGRSQPRTKGNGIGQPNKGWRVSYEMDRGLRETSINQSIFA